MVKKVTQSNRWLAAMLLISLVLYSQLANAVTITASTDRNPVSLNESFHLTYKSNGAVDGDPDFSPLKPYLDILSRSQSSNMSFIDGSFSSSKTWTLTVMAKRTGKFTLPAIYFGHDQSLSLQIDVTPASKQTASQSLFYARLSSDRKQAYAQQQIAISVQMFSARNVSAYGLSDLDFNGSDVVARQLGDEKQYQTLVGGREYLVIERRYAIFPQSDGLLQISPVMVEGRLETRGSTFFDPFNGAQTVRARSNALKITVLPIPKNAPANPWLPARRLELTEQWPQTPPQFVEGEPITRTLSIKADGLTSAPLPELPRIKAKDWKQYPDQPMLNDIVNDDGITGYRVEKTALIPIRPGKMTLPAIDIKWWNTRTQKIEVAHLPARVIKVAKSTAKPVTTQPVQAKKQLRKKDNPIKVKPIGKELLTNNADYLLWKNMSFILGAGWLLTLLFWWLQARRKKLAPSAQVVVDKDMGSWRRDLKQACKTQNLTALRAALLLWGEQYYEQANLHTLQQVSARLPQELAQQIRRLDAILYGAKQETFDCQQLLQSVDKLQQQKKSGTRKKAGAPLEPLYK